MSSSSSLPNKGKLGAVRAADCVVAFSRRQIYGQKRAIELGSPHRCAVVYGSLVTLHVSFLSARWYQ